MKVGEFLKNNIGALIFSVALVVVFDIFSVAELEYGAGRYIATSLLFIPLGFAAWVAGNAIRKALHPDFVITSGFWGLLKEKIFWRIGPQLILSFIVISIASNAAQSSIKKNIRPDRTNQSSVITESNSKAGDNKDQSSTGTFFIELTKEEFIRVYAGDNQLVDTDVSRLATMVKRENKYLNVTGTLTREDVRNIESALQSYPVSVMDLSGVTGWENLDRSITSKWNFWNIDAIILGDEFVKVRDGRIGENRFQGSNLKAIYLPDTVTRIDHQAFIKSGLTEIVIPPSVTEIAESAFNSCADLRYVYFSEKAQLASIGLSAFADCKKLYEITIPNSVKSIGAYAFGGSGLTDVHFDFATNSQLETIGGEAFASGYIDFFAFPDSIKYIGANVLGETVDFVIISATNPPEAERAFPKTIRKIIVPAESLKAYEDAWFDYEFTFNNQLTDKLAD